MKWLPICAVLALGGCAVQASSVAAVAQEQATQAAKASEGAAEPTKSGIADGASSPDEMGNRRPLYRLRRSDVLEIKFTFAPEFDQTVSVQPDGFITLMGLDELYAQGLTVAELCNTVRQAYTLTLHDPEVTITLKDFEKPYFVASGAVGRPGKYELRGDATVTEGVAMAGGFTEQAKHSEVVLFRRISDFLAGCSPSLPTAETTERASSEIQRVIAENRLIAMEMKCLEEPLSDARKDYLLASRSEYVIQSYLSALGTDAECQEHALRVCERTDPGQCVAVPGELNGRRPN